MSIRCQLGRYKVRKAAARYLRPLLALTPRRRWPPSTLPSVGAIVEPTKPATGPISPELALVDPDLAAGARAALPDYPWPAPVRIEPREPTRHRRIPVAATFSFLSLAAFVGILGVSLLPTRDQPTFAAEGQRIQPAAPSSTPGVSPQPTDQSPNTGARPRPAAPEGKRPAAGHPGAARIRARRSWAAHGEVRLQSPYRRERARCRSSNPRGRSPGYLRRVRPTTRSPSSETAGGSTRRGPRPRG